MDEICIDRGTHRGSCQTDLVAVLDVVNVENGVFSHADTLDENRLLTSSINLSCIDQEHRVGTDGDVINSTLRTVAVGQNSASILCAFSVDDGVNGLGIDRILFLSGIRLGEREARLGESGRTGGDVIRTNRNDRGAVSFYGGSACSFLHCNKGNSGGGAVFLPSRIGVNAAGSKFTHREGTGARRVADKDSLAGGIEFTGFDGTALSNKRIALKRQSLGSKLAGDLVDIAEQGDSTIRVIAGHCRRTKRHVAVGCGEFAGDKGGSFITSRPSRNGIALAVLIIGNRELGAGCDFKAINRNGTVSSQVARLDVEGAVRSIIAITNLTDLSAFTGGDEFGISGRELNGAERRNFFAVSRIRVGNEVARAGQRKTDIGDGEVLRCGREITLFDSAVDRVFTRDRFTNFCNGKGLDGVVGHAGDSVEFRVLDLAVCNRLFNFLDLSGANVNETLRGGVIHKARKARKLSA